MEKTLLGNSYVAEVDGDGCNGDDVISVVILDTSTDVDINMNQVINFTFKVYSNSVSRRNFSHLFPLIFTSVLY
jgi:hypothetical protein